MLGVATALLGVLVLGGLMRREFGGWFELPVFPLTFWLVAITVPLVLAPSFPVSLNAISYIGLFLVVWGVSSLLTLLVLRNLKGTTPRQPVLLATAESVRSVANALTLAGMAVGIYSLSAQGFRLADALSLDSIEAIARANASDRYQRQVFPPLSYSVALGLLYASAGLNGARLAEQFFLSRRTTYVAASAPLIVALLFGIIENTKATPLYAITFLIGGALSSLSLSANMTARRKEKARYLTAGSLLVVGLAGALVMMQRMRYGLDRTSTDDAIDSLQVWAFGHVGGFSYWYDELCCGSELGWGQSSLAGIPVGVPTSAGPIQQPKPLGSGLFTNVDTMFSDVILDFGRAGALFVAALAGMASVALWESARRGSTAARFGQVLPFAVILWSFTTSLANYSSCIFAAALIVVVPSVLDSRSKRSGVAA